MADEDQIFLKRKSLILRFFCYYYYCCYFYYYYYYYDCFWLNCFVFGLLGRKFNFSFLLQVEMEQETLVELMCSKFREKFERGGGGGEEKERERKKEKKKR